jgi:glycerate kinase
MNDNQILGQAAAFFKSNYSALTAEAIVAFFVVADKQRATVGEIASAMGLAETKMFEHLGSLREGSGAGLVALHVLEGGVSEVTLTLVGEQAKEAFLTAIPG